MKTHATRDPFSGLMRSARVLGAIGPATAAAMAFAFGWSQGHDLVSHLALAILFASASVMVGYGLVFLRRAIRTGMPKYVVASIAGMLVVSFCAEFVSHFGYLAASKQATLNTAKVSNAAFERSGKAEAEAAANADALRSQLQAFKLTRSKAEAEAEMANKQAHRWWGVTEQCKATKGPDTRKFCTEYFAAVADAARADQHAALEAKLADADARLGKAREVSGGVVLAVSSGAAQAEAIAAGLTLSTKPSQVAVFWSLMGLTALTALVFVGFGLLNMIVWEFNEAELAGPGGGGIGASPEASTKPVQPFQALPAGVAAFRPVRREAADPASLKILGDLMRVKTA